MPKGDNNAAQRTQQRRQRTEAYAQQVKSEYAKAINDILALKKSVPQLPTGQMYSFDGDSRSVQQAVERVLRQLYSSTLTTIKTGVAVEWEQANKEMDAILSSSLGKKALSNPALAGWFDRNEKALDAFSKRHVDGMDLSKRVWNNAQQFREEMEVAMTVAIGEGESAGQMSRKVRQYLQDPDLMFRRFRYRDDNGEWQTKWKKRVIVDGKARFIDYDRNSYNTGAGVYRSSYRNAMRLARTETNMAYRRADHDRWQAMPFVLGQHIETSKTHDDKGKEAKDVCDTLAGDYPKEFVFDGWHPQCMCICTAILASEAERQRAMQAALKGEPYTPQEKPKDTYPKAFTDFVKHNEKYIIAAQQRGTQPYFLANNPAIVNSTLGKEIIPMPKDDSIVLSIQERAAQRHAQRTPEEAKAIQDKWNARKQEYQDVRNKAKDTEFIAHQYKEVDTSALLQYIKSDNINAMRSETAIVRQAMAISEAAEKPLLDLIPGAHLWHRNFTISELQKAHSDLKAIFDSVSNYPDDKQLKALCSACYALDKSQNTIKTWEVQKGAINIRVANLQYKIDTNNAKTQLDTIQQWLKKYPTATKMKQLVDIAQQAIQNKAPLSEVQAKTQDAVSRYQTLLQKMSAKAAKKAAQAASTNSNPFAAEAYTKQRKNAAVWAKSGKEADNVYRTKSGEVWNKSNQEEKDALTSYTGSGYHDINDALRGLIQEDSYTKEQIKNITSAINRSSYTFDIWLQRGVSRSAAFLNFGLGPAPSNQEILSLVGKTGVEKGFMSCGSAKGQGFRRDVIFNIYAPAGTKALYVEPFSKCGDGDGIHWDGKSKQSSIGDECETILQRGTTLRVTKVEEAGYKWFVDVEVIDQI